MERLEVGARRPDVAETLDVGVRAQRRTVGRDVVRQVLPEKRLAGLDPTLGVTRSAVANAARHTEGKQPVIIEGRGRQVREHPAVAAALDDGGVDGAAGRKAEVACRMSRARTGRRQRRCHYRLIAVNARNCKCAFASPRSRAAVGSTG